MLVTLLTATYPKSSSNRNLRTVRSTALTFADYTSLSLLWTACTLPYNLAAPSATPLRSPNAITRESAWSWLYIKRKKDGQEFRESGTHPRSYGHLDEAEICSSDWVLNQARLQVLHLFARAKASRLEAHIQYLHTLPYYGLWQHYNGRPPLPPREFAYLQDQLRNAENNLRMGVDSDWRKACLMYPEMLDYFFGLVEINFPDEKSEMVMRPQPGRRRGRRDSGHSDRGSSKKGRGRS